ncbi:hypothetical protein PISS_b0018 [Pseudoalteromonas issachenkonii]|uniref:Uncharacterized protein n=1 Tax=Pseudoalteromonas issachenkonii TaxID=152297 RepID=A0ABN5C7L9_9GAMM|nr:hypothetical protein PISS_b0018 [Pseudoalteromonas issachenkonii]
MLCGGELRVKTFNKTSNFTKVYSSISTTVYANGTLSTYKY